MITIKFKYVNYYTPIGYKVALVHTARKYLHAVMVSGGAVVCLRLKKTEGDYMTDNNELTARQAAKRFEEIGGHISVCALKVIDGALKQG